MTPPQAQDETQPEAKPALRLYNTLTRRKEAFEPINSEAVRLYVCGPTVYDFAHIGNARPVIVFDVLFRLLRHLYGPDHVVYTRNITDVDDKINARAARDYPDLLLNEAIAKVTEATERQFHEDVAALGCLPPTHEPRATQYIYAMRAMIERLIARGVAYVAEDHVLFSPNAMDALADRAPGRTPVSRRSIAPRYGTLAHRSLDEMLAGARVDVAPYKHDPMDFVLWKPSKPNEPGWPSPHGIAVLGRPGWHIECSAMSMATLLEPFGGGLQCDDPSRNVFDIHGGGIDLVFPHHENEIAQSCCAFGSERMANVWMHNGFLQVEGEKMAKSAGNFVTIHELLRGWKGEPWSGAVIRYAMLQTHYRQPIDWTFHKLVLAKQSLQALASRLNFYDPDLLERAWEADLRPSTQVLTALGDDLNTAGAISYLEQVISDTEKFEKMTDSERVSLAHDVRLLGLIEDNDHRRSLIPRVLQSDLWSDIIPEVLRYDRIRQVGQSNNDVYAIRSADDWFKSNGVQVSNDGIINLASGTDLSGLKKNREDARKRKDWKESDRLRREIEALGYTVKDEKDGSTTYELKR
jgi:cysteinyl-tRNA synthetase